MYSRLRTSSALLARTLPLCVERNCTQGCISAALGELPWAGAACSSAAPQSAFVPWAPMQVAWYAKGAKGKGGKAQQQQQQPDAGAAAVEFDMAPYTSQLQDAVEHLRRELAAIRTGRASPGLLEQLTVHDCSRGKNVPLHRLGTVVARNPQLLVVEVYDKADVAPIAEAVKTGTLKLDARTEGNEVLVPVPRPTLDVIKRYVKMAREEAEHARHRLRGVRRKALEAAAAAGGGSDAARRREKEVQAVVDRFNGDVGALLKAKEADLEANH